MKISIHFKSQSVAIAARGSYEIDPEEFERLEKDFLLLNKGLQKVVHTDVEMFWWRIDLLSCC